METMYTVVVDSFDNMKNYDIYLINVESNKLSAKITDCSFDEVIINVIDYNKKYKIHKIVTVHHDKKLKPYKKLETIINEKMA